MSTAYTVADHPRLSLSAERIERCRRFIAKDEHSAALADVLKAYADAFLHVDPIAYELEGRRLLGPVRKSLRRICFLAFAFRLWGERQYLDRCIREVEAVCDLKDWNPSHFLDTAEMATGLAYAYDWLFDELSAELKQRIRENLKHKAIELSFEQYQGWVSSTNNWAQVCHGGMVLAALAIYEDEPELFDRVYQRAVKHIPKAIDHSYAPDGAYPEGPGYWTYGTSFSCIMYDGLLTALGPESIQDFVDAPGFLNSAYYRIHMIGPDKYFYSYSDCGAKSKVGISPSMWWCAQQLNDLQLQGLIRQIEIDALPAVQERINEGIESAEKHNSIDRLYPFLLLWSNPVDAAEPLGCAFFGDGPNPVCSLRSAWNDSDATWLAAKGGNLEVGHSQMDGGSFVFVSDGVRWVHDLGADGYHNIETNFGAGLLWPTRPRRFEFMRLGLKAHSTLRINSAQHMIKDSLSPITHFNPNLKSLRVDLSKVWREQAQSVERGLALVDDKVLVIHDEVVDPVGSIEWNLVTVDEITIEQDRAIIHQDGKTCYVQIHEPAGAHFIKKSLKPDNDIEHQNAGFARLCIEHVAQAGMNSLVVQMGTDEALVAKRADLPARLQHWPNEE